MLFNTGAFAIFLPAAFAAYWLVGGHRRRAQNLVLLLASWVFYATWDWRFLSLLLVIAAVNWVAGGRLHAAVEPRRRRWWLRAALGVTLGALGLFKYFDFFAGSFAALLTAVGLRADPPVIGLILPLGISFYTLQALTYPLGIYHGRVEPVRDPVEFFAFASFFPLLVAGPIERAGRLLPQFARARTFAPDDARDGLRQILTGLLKKVLIADNLAPHVQAIFADPAGHDGATLFAGAVFFAVQVYGDFSGYSDIAIGVCRLFGFSVMQNFRYPFFARDIGEFWRRWHVALSTWLRDYVFAPLGGGYGSRPRQIRNVLVTFLASGLWHGAAWTYVVWGLLNGLYFVPLLLGWRIVATRRDVAAGRWLPAPREALAMAITSVAVVLGFVVFRAESLEHAGQYLGALATRPWTGRDLGGHLVPAYACAALLAVEWVQRRRAHALDVGALPVPVRWSLYVAGMLAFLILGKFGAEGFIYAQF